MFLRNWVNKCFFVSKVLYACLSCRRSIVYKSSELNIKPVFSSRHKKSVRTCRAHCVIGIAKHHQGNEQKKQIPHAVAYIVEKCVQPKLYTLLRIRKRQNERTLIFIPPLKVGDFITRNKARNAFLAQGFLPLGATKLVQYKKISKYQ